MSRNQDAEDPNTMKMMETSVTFDSADEQSQRKQNRRHQAGNRNKSVSTKTMGAFHNHSPSSEASFAS